MNSKTSIKGGEMNRETSIKWREVNSKVSIQRKGKEKRTRRKEVGDSSLRSKKTTIMSFHFMQQMGNIDDVEYVRDVNMQIHIKSSQNRNSHLFSY